MLELKWSWGTCVLQCNVLSPVMSLPGISKNDLQTNHNFQKLKIVILTLNLSASAISPPQSNSSGCSTSLVSALSVQQQRRQWAWPLPETRVGSTNHSCPGVGWQDPAIWIKPQTTWSLHLLILSPLNSLISLKM